MTLMNLDFKFLAMGFGEGSRKTNSILQLTFKLSWIIKSINRKKIKYPLLKKVFIVLFLLTFNGHISVKYEKKKNKEDFYFIHILCHISDFFELAIFYFFFQMTII